MTRLLACAAACSVLLASAASFAQQTTVSQGATVVAPALLGTTVAAPTADAAADGDMLDGAVIETIRLGALDLVGRHVRPAGVGPTTFLIVHDTLGAYGDPLIVRVQTAFAKRGFASLAVNLSLGETGRMVPFECNQPHRHRHEDALNEIDAWLDWLLGQGLGPIVLAGHGRGGAQVAWHLATRAKSRAAAGVLLAPSGWTPRQADAEYRARYAAGLSALLTRIAGAKPDDLIEGVPFLHCGAASATQATIKSYYGVQPMRDTPTALAQDRIPTIVLLPDASTAAAEDKTFERFAMLTNPEIVVRTIDGSDSQFSGDAAFDAMMDAIDAYLRSIFPESR